MTISIKGTLLVKRIKQSRNGPFCVADLLTDVGEFKVKDPLLDQFDEGEYKGTFWVAEFYMAQYIDSYGRAVTEMRARLQDLQVDSERNAPRKRIEERELDPAEENPPVRVPKDDVPAAKPAINKLTGGSGKPTRKSGEQGLTDKDRALFGDEIFDALDANTSSIKLDPTISDRVRFRNQAARMVQLGYEFNSKTQTYHKTP